MDPLELAVLWVFGAVSLWVVAVDLWQVVVNGRVWTGTDGLYIVDQMQYLAWVTSASHHLLASNLFVLRSTPADYFQPAVAISGGLAALGLSPTLALLVWKPVAVVGMFYAVRAYAHRSVRGRWPRLAVIVLALFFGSFTVVYGSFGVLGDLFPGFLSWGYTFGLLALAAMTYALVSYDRALKAGRVSWVPGLMGAGASLLHPWHGELLILTVIVAELFLLRPRNITLRRLRLPALTLALTGLPLVYYLLLGRLDLSWKLAREASKHSFALWSIVLAILPLLILALFAYRKRGPGFLAAATRSWPIAALIVFIVSASGASATPLHAFQGITVPLAVLAVEAVTVVDWRRVRYHRVIIGTALVLLTVPATAYELYNAGKVAAPTPGNANFITRDERSAIDYLAVDRDPGGVLTRAYLGAAVPGKTGRRVLVGDCLWSEPHCHSRGRITEALFGGRLSPAVARRFVRHTGARFILADCHTRTNLYKTLRPLIVDVRRFGCATVFETNLPGFPLAKSEEDAAAALRAPGRQ
jgi:hypothetical protein